MKKTIEIDGKEYDVVEVVSVETGDQGTVWQYKTADHKKIVVVPFETKPFTAGTATVPPKFIRPALAGQHDFPTSLGFLFSEIVLGEQIGPDAKTHIRDFIEKFGESEPDKPTVEKFYDEFVCLRGKPVSPQSYWDILDKLEAITAGKIQAQDVREALFLTFSPGMKQYLLKLGREVAEERACTDLEALNFVLGSSPYVADFGNGTFRLLRSFTIVSGPDPLPKGYRKTPHEKKVSDKRAKAAREKKKVTPEQEKKIKDHYWSLRRPADPKKKPATKRSAGILTDKWIRRSRESGGLGLTVEYSSRHIQRIAGDAK